MNRVIAITLVAVAGLFSAGAQAASVTIDFEEFSIGDGPLTTFDWFSSQGYEFNGRSAPGCSQYGCPPDILIGDSGSKSLGASNGWNGQDGYGAQVEISMRKSDGGAFAISSIDLSSAGLGGTYATGILAGGGTVVLTAPVGTGDWLNLELVTFRAEGDCCGEFGLTFVELDNITVSAVPVPGAIWLFGSALAGLGWMRRKPKV